MLGFIEKEGTGIQDIKESLKDNNNPIIVYDADGDEKDFTTATIFANEEFVKQLRENEEKVNASIAPITSSSIKLPKKQRIVYETIMKNPGLRKPIICKISNLNNNSVNDAIRALSKKELIKYQGSSKAGGYFTK